MSLTSVSFSPPAPVTVYLGFGANVGKPAENIGKAFKLISSGLLQNAVISSLYLTEPRDVISQPDFINAACMGSFSGSAAELLSQIGYIEKTLGRNRKNEQRRGPRTIDIDILLFGNYIISEGREQDGEGNWLRIPHERLNTRLFELIPMLELNPELKDPLSGRSFKEIAASLNGQGIYTIDKLRYI